MHRLFVLGFSLFTLAATTVPLSAQTATTGVTGARQTYAEGRAKLDELVMQRRLGDAIRLFDQVVEVDEAELAAIDSQMQQLYTQDFENVGLVRSAVHKNGFRQEIIAYWTGRDYLYLYLFLHTHDNEMSLLNYRFDTDFHALNALF